MERLFCNAKQLEAWVTLNEKYGTLRALQLFKDLMELEQSIEVFCEESLDYQMIEEVNERVCEDRPGPYYLSDNNLFDGKISNRKVERTSDMWDVKFSDLRDPNVDCGDYDR